MTNRSKLFGSVPPWRAWPAPARGWPRQCIGKGAPVRSPGPGHPLFSSHLPKSFDRNVDGGEKIFKETNVS